MAHLPAQLTQKKTQARTVTPVHVESSSPSNNLNGHNAPAIQTQPIEPVQPAQEVPAQQTQPTVGVETPSHSLSPYFNADGSIRPMWQVEREAIQNAIAYCDGNVLNAAVMLELSPSTVYRKNKRGKRMKLISNNPDLPIVGEVWIFVDSRILAASKATY